MTTTGEQGDEAGADGIFPTWAIAEFMGHRRLGGYLTEVVIAGAPFIRIDIHGTEDQLPMTQLYAGSAVYAITPTTEAVARAVGSRNMPEPVYRYELPAPKEAPEAEFVDIRDRGGDEGEETPDPINGVNVDLDECPF